MSLSDAYASIIPVLNAPWREQLPLFKKTFLGDIFLLSIQNVQNRTFESVAITDDEIAPLRQHLTSISGQAESAIRIRKITVDELCAEQDPRNGNIQEGLENRNFAHLIFRLRHLTDYDLEAVEKWIWKADKPHPLIFRPSSADNMP